MTQQIQRFDWAIAPQNIQSISTEDKVELTSPNDVAFTAGGSQIKINAEGIFITTAGRVEVKAAEHQFQHGAMHNVRLPVLPKLNLADEHREKGYLLVEPDTQKALPLREYRLITASGEVISGFTDKLGFMSEYQDGLLEILPVQQERYNATEVAHAQVALDWPEQAAESAASAKKYDVPPDRIGGTAFLAAAKKKDPTLAARIQDMAQQDYHPDAYPNVPKGARLLDHTQLLGNRAGVGKNIQYENWFDPKNSDSDAGLYACAEFLAKNGYLYDKYFYIFAHANPRLIMKEKKYLTSVQKIKEQLNSTQKYHYDRPLVIMGCQAGNGVNSIAEQLSKASGFATVYAMTALGWFRTQPSQYQFIGPYGRFLKTKGGRHAIREEQFKGEFRVFSSAVAMPKQRATEPSVASQGQNGLTLHTVQRGETLSSIAKRYQISVSQICAENNICDPNIIQVGKKLRIPVS